ncbi:MAG: hypothetical protein MZU84_04460 [Sphingobacterium sp.]|nr:hypothetical protein [Sphingobacterium sp.]
MPGAFGDVSDGELQRYGGVLTAHYARGGPDARARDGGAAARTTCCWSCPGSAWSR